MNSLLTALAVLSHPQLDGEMAFTLESRQKVLGIERRPEGEDTGLKTYLVTKTHVSGPKSLASKQGCKSFATRPHFGVCLIAIYNVIYVPIYDIIYISTYSVYISMYVPMLHLVPEVSQKCQRFRACRWRPGGGRCFCWRERNNEDLRSIETSMASLGWRLDDDFFLFLLMAWCIPAYNIQRSKNLTQKSTKDFEGQDMFVLTMKRESLHLLTFYHKSGHQWLGDSRCIFHSEVAGTGQDSRFWERTLLTVDAQHRRAKLGKIVGVKLDGEEWLRNVDNFVLIIVWDQFVYPFLTISNCRFFFETHFSLKS